MRSDGEQPAGQVLQTDGTGRKRLEGEVSSYNRLTEAMAKAPQTA
jgi:hypothetical protein